MSRSMFGFRVEKCRWCDALEVLLQSGHVGCTRETIGSGIKLRDSCDCRIEALSSSQPSPDLNLANGCFMMFRPNIRVLTCRRLTSNFRWRPRILNLGSEPEPSSSKLLDAPATCDIEMNFSSVLHGL